MSSRFVELTAVFDPEDFVRWKLRGQGGELFEEWASEYPDLFDEDDVRLVRNDESKYHFFEWWGAIQLYREHGCRSLVEQYAFAGRHPGKWARFQEILRGSPEVIDFICHRVPDDFGQVQPPDLFVYGPDLSEWFFCDVKSPRDRLGPKQEAFFAELARRTSRPVRILKLYARA